MNSHPSLEIILPRLIKYNTDWYIKVSHTNTTEYNLILTSTTIISGTEYIIQGQNIGEVGYHIHTSLILQVQNLFTPRWVITVNFHLIIIDNVSSYALTVFYKVTLHYCLNLSNIHQRTIRTCLLVTLLIKAQFSYSFLIRTSERGTRSNRFNLEL